MPRGQKTTPKCGARKKDGSTCGLDAGWGTDHTGTGQCKFHGGSTTDGILSAAKSEAAVMGVGIDVSPHSALLECVRITAGEVVYCSERIAELNDKEALEVPIEIVTTEDEDGLSVSRKEKVSMLNIWIRARASCMDRLTKYAKMALDAGVDERRVRVAEGMAASLAPVLKAIFDQLDLTEAQKRKAPQILKRELLQLEGESMANAATS